MQQAKLGLGVFEHSDYRTGTDSLALKTMFVLHQDTWRV